MPGQANLRIIDDRDFAREMRAQEAAERRHNDRLNTWLQIAIVVLTMTSLWLVTSAAPYAKYGYVVGLASQPFWIIASARSRQWGMFFVAILMIGIWARGIANAF